MKKEDLMFISNLTEHIPKEEYFNLSAYFESLDAMHRITNSSMFVIDFAKNELIYRTKNLLFIDDATQHDIQRESSNPYWSLIVEEDFDIMLETRKAYLTLVEKFTSEHKLQHTYIISYRICFRHQECVISQKFSPLKLRPNGKLWLGLFSITISPHKACKHISVFGDKFKYTYDFKTKQFLPFKEDIELTLMEKSILLRASKGFTTEQIADDLCRSVNTIKTHKCRLFNKLHVTSMCEAIVFVQNYNLY